MKIAEAATRSGLSIDTIRFYERAGLLPIVERGPDGHRRFSAEALRWLVLFERLRSTGMPMREMKRYADLAAGGEATMAERLAILEAHLVRIAAQDARIRACRDLIERKIAEHGGPRRVSDGAEP